MESNFANVRGGEGYELTFIGNVRLTWEKVGGIDITFKKVAATPTV